MNIRWNNPDWIQPESGSLVIVLVGTVMRALNGDWKRKPPGIGG